MGNNLGRSSHCYWNTILACGFSCILITLHAISTTRFPSSGRVTSLLATSWSNTQLIWQ
ncbi:hypothetical protein CALCODRAFT_59017 [Calocera cornea HHB12733]|uniref:Uncharacterized protein n=1 Tax=Calocera cornea HHB12733 TaxID=1353952 RepID=A0A165IWL6_9BASI|nr:hypothetical protein CALCODRAFT_59017 [Calocera cornea HHB12733]